MITGIHQPNFMPWIGYFKKIQKSDVFVFLDDVKCSKNSYFNRNKFSCSKKFKNTFWLTCPLNKSSYNQNLNDVFCKNTFFKKHINFFKMRHSKTCEKKFLDEILRVYMENSEQNDLDITKFNIDLIKLVCNQLDINAKFLRSSNLDLSRKNFKQDKLIEILNKLGSKNYISGNGAKDYQSDQKFKDYNINVSYLDFQVDKRIQINRENISIIDVMLQEGIWKTKQMILH